MSAEKVLDLTVKFGVVPLMFYWIFKLDNKLEDVESRLYDCYEDQIQRVENGVTKHQKDERFRIVAVLPDKCKTIKECLS